MTTWTIAGLVGTWDPDVAVAGSRRDAEAIIWPSVRLGDLVEVVPSTHLDQTTEWVWPSCVSELTGDCSIRQRKRPNMVGYRLGVNLRPDDVLFPRLSLGPCVLVQPEHAGVAFTDGFVALRPVRAGEGVLLWGVLSSADGIQMRQAIAFGGVGGGVALAQLLELRLQLPPLDRGEAIKACLPPAARNPDAQQVGQTTWTTFDATDGRWGIHFETLGLGYAPATTLTGIARVQPGSVNAKERVELPLPGYLPVCLPEHVRADRWSPSSWAAPFKTKVPRKGQVGGWESRHPTAPLEQVPELVVEEKSVSSPFAHHRVTTGGEILLPAVYRHLPAIAPAGWLVGRGVFAIVLNEPDRAKELVNWLKGAQGQSVLKRFVSGEFVPSLTLSALKDLPLPHNFGPKDGVGHAETRLAFRLQDALR